MWHGATDTSVSRKAIVTAVAAQAVMATTETIGASPSANTLISYQQRPVIRGV
jgi:hypothetical protein